MSWIIRWGCPVWLPNLCPKPLHTVKSSTIKEFRDSAVCDRETTVIFQRFCLAVNHSPKETLPSYSLSYHTTGRMLTNYNRTLVISWYEVGTISVFTFTAKLQNLTS